MTKMTVPSRRAGIVLRGGAMAALLAWVGIGTGCLTNYSNTVLESRFKGNYPLLPVQVPAANPGVSLQGSVAADLNAGQSDRLPLVGSGSDLNEEDVVRVEGRPTIKQDPLGISWQGSLFLTRHVRSMAGLQFTSSGRWGGWAGVGISSIGSCLTMEGSMVVGGVSMSSRTLWSTYAWNPACEGCEAEPETTQVVVDSTGSLFLRLGGTFSWMQEGPWGEAHLTYLTGARPALGSGAYIRLLSLGAGWRWKFESGTLAAGARLNGETPSLVAQWNTDLSLFDWGSSSRSTRTKMGQLERIADRK